MTKRGAEVIIHICGDTTPILGKLAETGAACLSVDESVDLAEAKKIAGRKTAIFGNVSVNALLNLDEREIDERVKLCISKAGKHGYIVSSSCGLHARTPRENLAAMVKAARKYSSSYVRGF